MFIYKASRYHAPIQDEYPTIQECIDRAQRDMDSEQAWPIAVEDEAGHVVLSEDDLHKAIGTVI